MKKLLLLSILIFLSINTRAQTLVQTMDYIESNLLNYAFKGQYYQCSENALQVTTKFWGDMTRKGFTQLSMKDVKSVNHSIETDFVKITVTGACVLFDDSKITYDNTPSIIVLYLAKSIPLENVKRIIKAIKHAASLEGAKLIDEDLFKD